MITGIETSLQNIYTYISSNVNNSIALINSKVTDGKTISPLICNYNSFPDFQNQSILGFYGVDINLQNGMPSFPAIKYAYVIQIRTLGKQTSSNATTINTLLYRYADAMYNMYYTDSTLGGSADIATIDTIKFTFDSTTHIGYADFYGSAEIYPTIS